MSRKEQMAISLVDACRLAIQDLHVSGACLDCLNLVAFWLGVAAHHEDYTAI